MLAIDPALTPAQIKAYILSTVTPVPGLAGLSGAGGVLNADAAVEAVVAQTEAPVISFVSAPPASSTATTAAVSFALSGGGVTALTCTLDGVPSTPCAAGAVSSFTDMSVGTHTFVVSATGPGGTGSATATWAVTAPPPAPTPSPIPAPTPSPTPAPRCPAHVGCERG